MAVTDPGWYEHLASEPGPKDANFWRPSTRANRLVVGTPFLFKLKAPENAIAGFGYFASFSILPDWLAWDTFGAANGVASLDELRNRLNSIRVGARIQANPGGLIGCCLIAEAHFFQRDAWIKTPNDWPSPTQTGVKYDLSKGEGLRVWMECRERVQGLKDDRNMVAEPSPRFGTPSLCIPRLGQGIFRVMVLDAYGRSCAVTHEHSLPVLDAAHIKPFAVGGQHQVANGLSLRSDLHRLFDRGYVTVDENYQFVVGDRLKADFDNGHSYYGMRGQALRLPADRSICPSQSRLEWHRQNVFLG